MPAGSRRWSPSARSSRWSRSQGRERRNRRAVTEVSGFVKTHPAVLNGKYAQIVFREYVGSAVRARDGAAAGGEAIDRIGY